MSKRSKGRRENKLWEPLKQVVLTKEEIEKHKMQLLREGYTIAMVEKAIKDECSKPMYRNNRYFVIMGVSQVNENAPEMVHLKIRRIDRKVIRNWQDFQRIKNELVGPEHEAVELYPAESRLMNSLNQYHLWVLPNAETRFPIGYWIQRVPKVSEEAEDDGDREVGRDATPSGEAVTEVVSPVTCGEAACGAPPEAS